MSSEWKMVRLGDCANITMGQSPESSSYNTNKNGLPFYQGNADFGVLHPQVRCYCNNPSKFAYPNNILMSVRAPVGALNIANNDCCIGRGLCAISEKTDVTFFKYIYYNLLHSQSYIQSLGVGSTFKAVSGKIVSDLLIPLPSLDRQREIAAVLDKASELIEKRKEQLSELDTLAESVFYDMFGDPVTNPKSWGVSSLKSLTTKIGSGATPKGGNENYKSDGISLIRSLNVHNSKFKYKALAFIDELQAKALDGVTVEQDDVLLNITGASVARCCIVPNSILPARVNQHVAILRVKKDRLNFRFLCSILISNEFQIKLLKDSKSNGATREALTKPDLENLIIITPPIELQNQFAEIIEKIEVQKATVKEALKESENLFQRLMQDMFNPQQHEK